MGNEGLGFVVYREPRKSLGTEPFATACNTHTPEPPNPKSLKPKPLHAPLNTSSGGSVRSVLTTQSEAASPDR